MKLKKLLRLRIFYSCFNNYIPYHFTEARHFFERHFFYYDTSSTVFVELPVHRKVCSSNTFLSKSHLVDFFLESFWPDYERATIEAVKTVFLIDKIEGCFFHLSQAHWNKIQELGLRTLYTENEDISVSALMLTALAFCPVSGVDIAFKELQENLPEPLHSMIEYMERTHIGSTTFN